jgi:hypothetical protein
MNPTLLFKSAAAIALLAFAGAQAHADIVETKNGARMVGQIVKISDGSITLKTDYAGELAIKQSEVTSIATDAQVSVRLQSGTVLQGMVTTDAGAVKIAGADGQLSTTVEKVAATWPAGGEDPQTTALRRHWKYEAAADITGKTGNKEQLGTTVGARATLKTPQDTLLFYTAYDRQVADGAKSADQFKAGVDYTNNFSGKKSWYVRDEGGFDRVKAIKLYNVAAFGVGYDVIMEPLHLLTLRTGISYRYEGYYDPLTPAVSSAGLDVGLNHEWTFANSKLVNRIAWVPSFQDFANYKLSHESFYEIPLIAPNWKLRLGLSNDYTSKVAPGIKRLDTSYFTRFVFSWE